MKREREREGEREREKVRNGEVKKVGAERILIYSYIDIL